MAPWEPRESARIRRCRREGNGDTGDAPHSTCGPSPWPDHCRPALNLPRIRAGRSAGCLLPLGGCALRRSRGSAGSCRPQYRQRHPRTPFPATAPRPSHSPPAGRRVGEGHSIPSASSPDLAPLFCGGGVAASCRPAPRYQHALRQALRSLPLEGERGPPRLAPGPVPFRPAQHELHVFGPAPRSCRPVASCSPRIGHERSGLQAARVLSAGFHKVGYVFRSPEASYTGVRPSLGKSETEHTPKRRV
jgi:hypothetical protein